MAKMPEHAKLIPNPKTFAAGFYVENVFVLPGVPRNFTSDVTIIRQKYKNR